MAPVNNLIIRADVDTASKVAVLERVKLSLEVKIGHLQIQRAVLCFEPGAEVTIENIP